MRPPRASALIVGDGPGLGSALQIALAAEGFETFTLSRSRREESHQRHLVCDVTDEADVRDAFATLEDRAGVPEVVIYNAAHFVRRPFRETTAGDFETSWRVNGLGAFHCAAAVLPGMLERGGGTLVFSGATASRRGGADFGAFASSKFALRGLAQSLSREYGEKGVHVVHALLDGMLWGPRARKAGLVEGQCLSAAAVAREYVRLACQEPMGWTNEIDLRPFCEPF